MSDYDDPHADERQAAHEARDEQDFGTVWIGGTPFDPDDPRLPDRQERERLRRERP